MDPQNNQQPQVSETSFQDALKIFIVWALCCAMVSSRTPATRKPIEYYPTIQELIAEYNVVREHLIQSKKASEEVGQQYTIITFDLGVRLLLMSKLKS